MSDGCSDGACAIDFSNPSGSHDHQDHEEHGQESLKWKLPLGVLGFLLLGIALDYFEVPFFTKGVSLIWFGILYLVIGRPVLAKAFGLLSKGDVYNEFVLMSIATLGAFFIGYYEEGVAVMLFYIIGEIFQEAAVKRAKRSIESLLKIQVEKVTLWTEGKGVIVHPRDVMPGSVIKVNAGEKVALDGKLISDNAVLNASALTGESLPVEKESGDDILAGMVNLKKVITLETTKKFEDTKLSNILTMVREATGRKAKTQLMISRLAKIYTPIVFWLAVALLVIPYFVLGDQYEFSTWLQRSLVFLVISCPCALVISIPLGYFGGIGAASRNGILFKGSNFLDMLTEVDTVVLDKTGTVTSGVFEVIDIIPVDGVSEEDLLEAAVSIERFSSHPIAEAVVKFGGERAVYPEVKDVNEISGHGMKGIIDGKEVLAGNAKLMSKNNVSYPEKLTSIPETVVMVAIDGIFSGYLLIADRIKDDAISGVKDLRKEDSIKEIVMLSGDKQDVVDKVSKIVGIDRAIGDLLPEDKMTVVEKMMNDGRKVVFVGDGINDAPVLAASHVGMAMGGMGSDVAVETADVIIQTDQPSKIATAIRIGYETKKIIWQNIFLALGVKILVLILGAMGMATLWEAVIADVGVALLAILNAVRIQRMKF